MSLHEVNALIKKTREARFRTTRRKWRAGTVRIVLDINVVVSGLLSESSPPAQIVDLCLPGDVDLVVDGRMVVEYEKVPRRPELCLLPGLSRSSWASRPTPSMWLVFRCR